MTDEWVTPKVACGILKVHSDTLRKWGDNGKLEMYRPDGPGSHRRYNVRKFLGAPEPNPKRNFFYARVSSRQQKDDLERQVEFLREKFPDYELVKDIGSGLNFKRAGLRRILDATVKGDVGQIVVTYRDRLCRFGYELIDYMVKTYSNGEIVVLSEPDTSKEKELVDDLLSIITVFSARSYGLRKYKREISKDYKSCDSAEQRGETDVKGDLRPAEVVL